MEEFKESLTRRAKEGPQRIVLFPEGREPRVIEAARKFQKEGMGKALMLHPHDGSSNADDLEYIAIDETRAQELAKLLVELRGHKGMTVAEAEKLAHDPVVYGTYLVRLGEADAIVAGAEYKTADVVRAGLWLLDKEPGIKTVSSAFYMMLPPFRGDKPEVITFADCGIVEVPTAEQLADIAISAADARKFVVGDEPKLAFLSFSTKGSGGSGESITRLRRAIDIVKEKRPDIALADHEMQGDAALLELAAKRKGLEGGVGGSANVLIFPSLDAGNIAYKLVELFVSGAKAIGPVGHGFDPKTILHDVSRNADADAIFWSAVIAVVRAKGK